VRAFLFIAVICLVAVPAAGAGWIVVPPKRPCPALPDGYVCSTKTQVTFGYPASWGTFPHDNGGFLVRSLIWVGTEPFREPCASTTDAVSTTVTCGPPASALRPNGLAAVWSIGGTRGLDLLPGEATTIGGLPAKVNVLRPGCASLGADEEITARVEGRERGSYSFRACLRGPDLHSLEAAVASVLAAARFPYG
jgi:hypothetical protein